MQIYSDTTRTLEGPVSSTDGRYLVFSASEPGYSPNRTTWNIYTIDLEASAVGKVEPLALTQNIDRSGNYISNRWPFWLDENSLIYSGFTLQNEYVYKIFIGLKWPTTFYPLNEPLHAPQILMPVYLS